MTPKKTLALFLFIAFISSRSEYIKHGFDAAIEKFVLYLMVILAWFTCRYIYIRIKQLIVKLFPPKQRERQMFFPPDENQQTMTIDEIEEEVIKNEETMKINQRRELIRKKQY